MLYDIKLNITYNYGAPAAASRTLLRMLPRDVEGQRVLQGQLTCDPLPSTRQDSLDFFGNMQSLVAHDLSMAEVSFLYEGRIHRQVTGIGLDLSGDWAGLPREIAQVRHLGPDAPHHFLGASTRVRPEPKITEFARDHAKPGQSTLDMVRGISAAIYDYFNFDAEATDVGTTPLEAFEAKHGVCQDISHVTIAALRGLGVPAGYVSGYLRTEPPEGQPRLEGADAMHAWVRAWCGQELGWIELDPTNNIDVVNDHVVVAYGRDYSDVAPVRGAVRSSGEQGTLHQVDMIPVEGPAIQPS